MRNFLVLAFLLLCAVARAQTPTYNLPPKTFYKRVNITLKDFSKFECKSVTISPENVSFINLRTSLNESLPIHKIDYMRVQEGTQAAKWACLGALFMGVTAALNVYEYPESKNQGSTIVTFTISGAVIGGLIGLAIPKWKTYYLDFK